MNKIVDRDTFLYYLNNADVNWEATARECITKSFELAKENKKLKEKLEEIKEVAKNYRENCKIEGNCLDKRLCSTCYFGGGLEVCEYIADIIEGAEK